MATLNGGYTQIDCTGIELNSAEKQTVAGIYKQVETAYKANKQVIACNATFAEAGCTPISVMVNPAPGVADTYVCTAATLQLWIDKENGVTVVNMAPSNRSAKTTK